MSIAPIEHPGNDSTADSTQATESPRPRRPRRRSTSHLKDVPDTLAHREKIKAHAEEYAKNLDPTKPFNKAELEACARELLAAHGEPEKYLGFAMVLIGNFFWKRQFLAIPFERRMLLLPHCLKHAEGCPAEYDEFGLDCETCGACSIADYKVKAEKLGYKVLVAEGSPIVLKIIVAGYIDGILGVSCLNVLEKAIDKVLIAGVPSYAIPLHSGDCKNTSLDEAWVWDVLEVYEPLEESGAGSFVPLMRSANRMFDEHFERLLPPVRGAGDTASSPIAETERLSYDWLANGGKRLRPFMTLAAYHALTGDDEDWGPGADAPEFSDAVSRVAMAIEAFHKASLVHDDIQDDDMYRYGRETLHRQRSVGTAINVGDHLIGLGYKLVSRARPDVEPAAVADIIDRMADAHLKLCDGQGAEMTWQEQPSLELSPREALQIAALKTSPAFDAALYAGIRMAGSAEDYDERIASFSRNLGIGFQIRNDLKDWDGDDNNKLIAGQDALACRPTVLLALALQNASDEQRDEIEVILSEEGNEEWRTQRLRMIFEECRAFEQAEALVEKTRQRVEALADEVEPLPLRRLFYFLIDVLLAEDEPTPEPQLQSDDAPALIPLSVPSQG